MSELCRVLKNDDLTIVDVPWTEALDRIYENPAITTPEGRMKAFGQRDYVRRYSKDVLDRLRAAGFHAEVVRARDIYSDEDAGRYGFRGEKLLLCAKSATHTALASDA